MIRTLAGRRLWLATRASPAPWAGDGGDRRERNREIESVSGRAAPCGHSTGAPNRLAWRRSGIHSLGRTGALLVGHASA
jgi:hypothetical protein